MPKKEKHIPIVLDENEINLLLEAPNMKKASGIRDKAMLEMMYGCGLRVSELVSLQNKSINYQEKSAFQGNPIQNMKTVPSFRMSRQFKK